jgi:hypothetical protein
MSVQYNLGKVSQHCSDCGRKFQDKEEVFSSIVESETQLERRDFCSHCWQKRSKDGDCVFWSRKFDRKKKTPVFSKSAAFELFQRLAEGDTAQSQDFCYVLALLLMRKKVLHLESAEVKGADRFLILRSSGAEKTYQVLEPVLSEDRLQYINQNLSEVFETVV